jgi:hypothetical protein
MRRATTRREKAKRDACPASRFAFPIYDMQNK